MSFKQSDVDDATMRIEDPSRVVGSGFIQFPPQLPFQNDVVIQPATVAVDSRQFNKSKANVNQHLLHEAQIRQAHRRLGSMQVLLVAISSN
ncbi:hypothetical protein BE221DRAFT_63665 [Ostreococcus tauri]|uniref:Uncharacterized protein n=1 Tax=Ostreococcus tauri TaxID=70448 RepID=A0A1Y5I1P7_OSTTA|nr:hypothetical protein BE221DRAFT_63665 [Ostreococcus tauri]